MASAATRVPDNGASFAGRYGLANPTVAWLINRGYGELVALTPEEMQAPTQPPRHCGEPMLYRGDHWLCPGAGHGDYEPHDPLHIHIPPRLQKMPAPPFSWQDVVGKEVDLVYTREYGEQRASWKYVVDGKLQR